MTRTQKINRLAKALTYYRENRPSDPRFLTKHVEHVAIRFGFSMKLMRGAVQMMSGVDAAGRMK